MDSSRAIVIQPYDDSWPAEFARVEALLRESLDEVAERIDHIGSTAVPGLAAKDVIDVQVAVAEPRAGKSLHRSFEQSSGCRWLVLE